MKDVIIVGGGASGLVCAIKLAQKGKDVLIIEKQDRIGKKILSTGNGRCNLTNISGYDDAYNTDLSRFLSRFDYNDTVNFFRKLNLLTFADEEGRIYPISNPATSVLDVLRLEIDRLNIDVKLSEEVQCIKPKDGSIAVITDKSNYASKNVVICVGGKKSETIFDNLDVKYIKTRPTLCSLKTPKLGSLNGIRQAGVLLKCRDFAERGEILFKDGAISGIVVFNLSAYLTNIDLLPADITIDLLPDVSFDELYNILNLRKSNKSLALQNLLTGIFHKELSISIIKACNMRLDTLIIDLSNSQIKQIVSKIKNFDTKIIGFCENNQVFAGGVDLNCLDDDLQIKSHKHIFVTGEAVNVNGKCGGYNLQWAFCSASVVANAID